VRCRVCHLTLKTEELEDGYCPECYDRDGRRQTDFEEVTGENNVPTRYRCEDCGVLIETDPQPE
jgi:rubrerythrin